MVTSFAASVMSELAARGGHPALTWYATDGTRLELSGYVVANWITKTTNLLNDEFSAASDTTVAIDLPAHWRTLTWIVATWRVGACSSWNARPPATDADIVATSAPESWSDHPGDVLAVALPALARRFPDSLPAGVIDAGPAVMGCSDALGFMSPVESSAVAVRTDGAEVTHGGLLDWVTNHGHPTIVNREAGAQSLRDQRVIVVCSQRAVTPMWLATVLSCWLAGASVICVEPTAPAGRDLAKLSVNEYSTTVVTVN